MNLEYYRQLKRRACRDSFWEFLLEGFGAKHNPKGKRWLDPEIHKPLCDWFQSHIVPWIEARRNGKGYPLHLMVLVPRDVGKTTTITQAGLLWMHLLDPDISTYIGSERTEFAIDILDPIKQILSGNDPYSRFSWLYGNWQASDRAWSQKQVVHAARTNLSRKEPSFGIWGVESGITGKHPDVLCLDDPTSYEKMASVGQWLHLVNAHIDSLIPVLPADGCLIFVGTRYSAGDHFGLAIDKEGIQSVSGMDMPGTTINPNGQWHCYFLSARDADGVPAIPSVWDEKRLTRYKNKNPLRYAAQVLNDPMNTEANELTRARLDQLIVDDANIPKNTRVTFHFDTAFKTTQQKARGDYSVIVEMAHSTDGTGVVYFLNAFGSNQMTTEEFRDLLLSRVQHYKALGKRISMMTDEPLIGKGEMWENTVRNWFASINLPCPPLEILHRGRTKKEARHVEAATFILDSKVYFRKNASGLEMLFDQLTNIGGSRNDDYIDAFSDAFHTKCYNVMHRLLPIQEQEIVEQHPWDEYLKGDYQQKLKFDLDNILNY